ncbi:CPBP family intramembrane glutamic endopeptidase [Terrabacter sp. Ter38]|uniref:CPBP family intramembrane glutamic endopeptidase n=1 Tax=Terrabacter sp. Ter38 TaxID=2926030 RepID=UPI002117FE4B|nr:CPBP family intramembrane glutamic endopeptidase [Terrabacter sp. Ter38]
MNATTKSPQTGSHPVAASAPGRSRRRRIAEAIGFVAVWMVAGFALHLPSNGYLLLGIPLTAAFQVLVRRRPLRELFAAGTDRFALIRQGMVVAAVLAATPAYYAGKAVLDGDWLTAGWYVAALIGAVAAGFALRVQAIATTLRDAARPIAVGAGEFVTVYGVLHVATGTPLPTVAALVTLVKYTALYFPATFLMEEVAFRGAIDAHVHHDGDRRGWASAVFVSALWGLWHLPVSSDFPLPLMVAELVVVHIALGVWLSFAWRRTGNLAAPALAHAVNDAVRNATMLGL